MYHRSVIIELLLEAGPGIMVNVGNYAMLRRAGLVKQMTWASVLSIFVSCYMILRTGFKYVYRLCWEGKSLHDIEVVPRVETDSERTVRRGQAIAGAVVPALATAKDLAVAAVQVMP